MKSCLKSRSNYKLVVSSVPSNCSLTRYTNNSNEFN